jgi:hypothetical protein
MKTFSDLREELMKGKDPCWKGYKMQGTKKKAGKDVPNCIPEQGFLEPSGVSEYGTSTGADVSLSTQGMPSFKKVPEHPPYKKKKATNRGPHGSSLDNIYKEDKNKPSSREWGTKSLANIYKKDTPGQQVKEEIWDTKNPVKKHKTLTSNQKAKAKARAKAAGRPYPNMVDNIAVAKEEVITERGADSKGYYRSTESGAGLTAKGAKHFGIRTAVTGKVEPGSKAAKRRKSFCARMGGMPGPMKDKQGRDTRKAASLKRWRCRT